MQQDNNNDAARKAVESVDSMRPDLGTRLREVKTTRWVRFAIVSVLFFAWVIWMGNPWLLLLWILLADIYITGFIPWTFWKKSKSKTVRVIMGWVDAIVYALILVYFIFAFIGQNYTIPSSSLEKSLLIGDYLWVNKTIYGPRVPQTPIHFPLAQHTLPITGSKSYIENPQLDYHRLPGLRSVERGDIVVFNYPQGDTVPTALQGQADYYRIAHDLRAKGISDPLGYMKANPQMFGKVIWRPVDRRENYVKRAIGLPGERLRIADDIVYINGKAIPTADNVQFNYIVPVSGAIPRSEWERIGVSVKDSGDVPAENPYDRRKYYHVPLTSKALAEVEKLPQVNGKIIKASDPAVMSLIGGFFPVDGVFPLGNDYGWTRPDMGEIWIPKRGVTLHLTPENFPIYERAIRVYEGNDLKTTPEGKFIINGKETEYYTFKMDYYWMMGDNRDMSDDSRYWGFVPEDHLVGSPLLLLVSLDEEKSLLNGKIRWNRILRNPNPDKPKW